MGDKNKVRERVWKPCTIFSTSRVLRVEDAVYLTVLCPGNIVDNTRKEEI